MPSHTLFTVSFRSTAKSTLFVTSCSHYNFVSWSTAYGWTAAGEIAWTCPAEWLHRWCCGCWECGCFRFCTYTVTFIWLILNFFACLLSGTFYSTTNTLTMHFVDISDLLCKYSRCAMPYLPLPNVSLPYSSYRIHRYRAKCITCCVENDTWRGTGGVRILIWCNHTWVSYLKTYTLRKMVTSAGKNIVVAICYRRLSYEYDLVSWRRKIAISGVDPLFTSIKA